MKKFYIALLTILVITICLAVVGCKKDDDSLVVTPNLTTHHTVSFDVSDFECQVPEAIEVEGGEILSQLPTPEVEDFPEYYELKWFTDEQKTQVFTAQEIYRDITLYLGYSPKTYTLTFVYDESLQFNGAFTYSYVYGETISLPQATRQKGYKEYGKWYYGDGEAEYYTLSVPATAYGDLTLTYALDPVIYSLHYLLNDAQAINPNPATYDASMGTLVLQPATAEGKEFDRWVYRTTSGSDPLANKKIESIDLDLMTSSGKFSLEAIWKN